MGMYGQVNRLPLWFTFNRFDANLPDIKTWPHRTSKRSAFEFIIYDSSVKREEFRYVTQSETGWNCYLTCNRHFGRWLWSYRCMWIKLRVSSHSLFMKWRVVIFEYVTKPRLNMNMSTTLRKSLLEFSLGSPVNCHMFHYKDRWCKAAHLNPHEATLGV